MYSVSRLIKELPENYEEECTRQGAVRRWRGAKNAGDLMMLIIIHLLNGTSLLETSIIAHTAKRVQNPCMISSLRESISIRHISSACSSFCPSASLPINSGVYGLPAPKGQSDLWRTAKRSQIKLPDIPIRIVLKTVPQAKPYYVFTLL